MVEKICDNCMSRVPADAEKCPKCGIQFENTNPGGALPNGWVLDERYTIGRYIDIDGEGVTYSAIDGDTLQRVVIKEFMPVTLCASRTDEGEIVAKPGCDVLFKTTKMDFVELYASLLDIGLSDGLVQVLDIFEVNNSAYAVLEKVEGPTLSEYLTRKQDPMEYNSVLTMLRSILVGTQTLHNVNIVHRGICPENIVLESGGTAKLTGYATLALRQQGTELKPKLYPSYSAPEQYSASEFEGKYTDIYALASVMYRMLTGESAPGAEERKIQDTLRAPRSIDKDIPNFISNSIMKAMRINSSERIQSVTDFRMALSGESMRGLTGAMPAVEKGNYPFGLNKKQMIIACCSVGAVVLILLIVLFASLFSGGGKDTSSTTTSIIAEVTIPNFVGVDYTKIQANSEYSQFSFDVSREKSDTVAEGLVISQTPSANTAWDGKTKITLVVSSGKEEAEEVQLPELSDKKLKDAKAELVKLGFSDSDMVVQTVENTGEYEADTVIYTNPYAGELATPGGAKKITLYVAGAASSATMPDVTGDTEDKAKSILSNNKFSYNNISTTTVGNDKGRQVNGTVQSTSPAAGATVTPGSQKVTLNVYEDYKMPDLNSALKGKTLAEAQAYCNQRQIPYNNEVIDVTGDAVGTVAEVVYTSNVVVTDSTRVSFKIYKAAPASAATPTVALAPTANKE